MEKSILRKKGLIKVSVDLLESEGEKIMKALFSQFYPIGVQSHDFGVICYFGYSNLFRELNEGEKTPMYEIRIKKHIENNQENIIIDNCEEV